MEKRHRCKLCFRNFANGRALGGHMRSHMMKFYEAEKVSKQEEGEEEHPFDDFQSVHPYSSTSSPSSSSSEEEEEEEEEEESEEVKGLLSYELRENPKKSTLLVDHELSFAAGSVVLQDRESETESSKKNQICRRSKRVRKSRISDFNRLSMDGFFQVKKSKFEKEGKNNTNEYSSLLEPEPLSSISDTTPEEHVAHCLIMLSRDKWKRDEIEYQEEEEEEAEEKKFGNDYSEDSGVVKVIKTTKVKGKYRCEACNKLFKSYQALGGHRASHKKIKVNTAQEAAPPEAAEKMRPNANSGSGSKAVAVDFLIRAGTRGHKRSHFIGAGAISANVSTTSPVKQNSRIGETLNIDLNLPAPTDDDEASQIAVSAVSDAEFVHPIKQ
ncbi:hypothetical protein Pfo_001397 [Paulownia fortunei]|nr:hypothetical protein Pfo_001397 [Paulownia fortunei]